MKYAWIKQYRIKFPTAMMCRVLEVCRSAFYRWINNPDRAQQRRRDALVIQIKTIRQEPFMNSYGSPRMFEDIEVFYNRKRRHSSPGYVSPQSFEASQN